MKRNAEDPRAGAHNVEEINEAKRFATTMDTAYLTRSPRMAPERSRWKPEKIARQRTDVACNSIPHSRDELYAMYESAHEEATNLVKEKDCHFLYHNTTVDKIANDVIAAQRYDPKTPDQSRDPIYSADDRPCGVFMRANVNCATGKPFRPLGKLGPVRFLAKIEPFLTQRTQLYFVSFTAGQRCSERGNWNWVTLLAVNPDANPEAHQFAETRLVKLQKHRSAPFHPMTYVDDLEDAAMYMNTPSIDIEPENCKLPPNPFLYYDEFSAQWKVTTTMFVDVFFTHDIPLDEESLDYLQACVYIHDTHGHCDTGRSLRPIRKRVTVGLDGIAFKDDVMYETVMREHSYACI